jgi:transposase InsO family protein
VHVEVLAANVLWHQDATHLGRTAQGEVQGDVVRDAAMPDVLAASVGGVVAAKDAVANLEAAIAAAGRAPLVQSNDNGGPYRSDEYEACLRRHRIVHLKNLPRTPQHNSRAERVIRDVKDESGLGIGVVLAGEDEAAVRVAAACRRLERRALIAPRELPLTMRYTQEQRDDFYDAVCRRIEEAVRCAPNARARRRAEREAIHAELEERGFIRRTRGGVAMLSSKPEINS